MGERAEHQRQFFNRIKKNPWDTSPAVTGRIGVTREQPRETASLSQIDSSHMTQKGGEGEV